MKSEKIRVIVEFPVCGKEYECGFPASMALRTCMQRLYELICEDLKGEFHPDGRELIFEKKRMLPCDPDVSIRRAGFTDGMHLVVY